MQRRRRKKTHILSTHKYLRGYISEYAFFLSLDQIAEIVKLHKKVVVTIGYVY